MECFLVFVLMVILVTLALVLRAGVPGRRRRRGGAIFEQLARRLHGTCLRGGWFHAPAVRFQHGQAPVLLTTEQAGGGTWGHFTLVCFPWNDPQFRCQLVARHPQPLPQDTSLPQFPIDNGLFDRSFVVRSNHPEWVRRFTSAGVQWQMQQLARAGGPEPAAVLVGQGQLTVRKYARFTTFADLEDFVLAALDLFDQAQLTQSVGIEFVDEDEVQVVRDAVCRICGEEIEEELVYCRRCKTPHHRDCWQYNGCCSTYGCREQRFAVPREARRAGPEG